MSSYVVIDEVDDDAVSLWQLAGEVSRALAGLPWVLIGGQMVDLIERELGGTVGRRTRDVDVLVDKREATDALREASRRLELIGFEAEVTPDGLSYRFRRGDDIVDILAPDHLGERADLVTSPPGVTLQVTGGTQALDRRREVTIEIGGGSFPLPVPTLTGAIVIKTRAVLGSSTNDRRARHLRDLARMLVLIEEVEVIRDQMTRKERAALRSVRARLDADSPAWQAVANTTDGIIALERLTA